ncbi:hypothetical protein EYF80_057050 [Liparis tanakae]|uniref:Uncharacterized protein n=1 Tax=Liparis tanakae TaxID=230148 RepID=A0A4Z2EV94_9TELE|nr:hypothetical protein EYF80_057050 [Liparis tanakae]
MTPRLGIRRSEDLILVCSSFVTRGNGGHWRCDAGSMETEVTQVMRTYSPPAMLLVCLVSIMDEFVLSRVSALFPHAEASVMKASVSGGRASAARG